MTQRLEFESPLGRGFVHICQEPDSVLWDIASNWQGNRVFVVTEGNLSELHRLPGLLYSAGRLVLPGGGEGLKTQKHLQRILHWLAKHNATRKDWLVAIGGGALTDVAGLAASLYKRGMPLVTIPTTLLAQVDAGLGGKNAINAFGLKNALGTFWYPREIICAAKYLDTLPFRQLNSGLGEVFKYQLLFPETDWLTLKPLGPKSITPELMARCCAYKIQVVAADPLDQNQRRRLNLGHTLAHALEALLPIHHGEAVFWGLEFALLVSLSLGHCPTREGEGVLRVLRSQPRPALPRLDFGTLWPLLLGDKKNTAPHRVIMVLPGPGGQVISQEVGRKELERCWQLLKR